jgi:hypothetical protein
VSRRGDTVIERADGICSRAAFGRATLLIVRVRGRAIGGAVLAVALVVAVVSLRGQAEPFASGPTPPATTTPSPPPLPVRSAEPVPQWTTYELPADVFWASADPAYIGLVRGTIDPAGRPLDIGLTVRSRDDSRQEFDYRPQPGWVPLGWQILDGALVVMEIPADSDPGQSGGRLMRVGLGGGGSVKEITVGSVRRIEPRLLTPGDVLITVGDELIGTGISVTNPAERCVIAIRPNTGVERTVACTLGVPSIDAVDGGVLIKLPDNSPDGCTMRLLTPDGGESALPEFAGGNCMQQHIIPLGGWQAYYDGPGPAAYPLNATDGTDRVVLGTANLTAVSCHGRLYWVSGGSDRLPSDESNYLLSGVEVLRWTPGASEVEVIRSSQDQTESFGPPTCDEGTLGVPVISAAGSPRMISLMMLERES